MRVLVTKRLTLRPPLEVDVEAIAQMMRRKAGRPEMTGLANVKNCDDMIARFSTPSFLNAAPADVGLMMTIHRASLIGAVAFQPVVGGWETGFWLADAYRGKGYMKEAMRAALSHAFRVLPMAEVVAELPEDRPEAASVLDSLGFTTKQNGTTTLTMSLTSETFDEMFADGGTPQAA